MPQQEEYAAQPSSQEPYPDWSSAWANAGVEMPEPGAEADEPEDEPDELEDEPEDELDELVDLPEDFELVEDDSLGDDAPEDEDEEEAGEEDEAAAEPEIEAEPESDAEPDAEPVPTLDDLVGPGVDLEQDGSFDQPDPEGPAGMPLKPKPSPTVGPPPQARPRQKAPGKGPAGLLDYLANMAGALPENRRKEFMSSDIRLKLEYLRQRLAGRAGLYRDGEKYARKPVVPSRPVTTERLRDTLQYMGSISAFHPDPEIGSVLRRRMTQVVARLRETSEG